MSETARADKWRRVAEALEAKNCELLARIEALTKAADGLMNVINTYLIDYDLDRVLEQAANKSMAAWKKAKAGEPKQSVEDWVV